MSHNIDMSNNQANIAFMGDRNDIWHRLGQQMNPGQSIEEWAKAAGLNWLAHKVPAIAALEGTEFDHIPAGERFRRVAGKVFVVRGDTGRPLGFASTKYQPVQPIEILEWFKTYIQVDDRFQLDVAGSLRGGEVIWATATYTDALDVCGEKHKARLLMTTTFDGSGSTINKGTMTRVVCNNTLDVSAMDKRSEVRTRHNTKFDAKKVGDELARIAQGFAEYKKMGEALALHSLAVTDVSNFFKSMLDIPFDTKEADVSTRKLNQFQGLKNAYRQTVAEGTPAGTAWTALNAITRYVDHDKGIRTAGGTIGEDEARFTSSQFGGGADMKAKAMGLLLPAIKDKIAVAA